MILYNKKINLEQKNDSAVILFDYVAENSTVLDVGCACGDLAKELHKYNKCKVYGLEYNQESVEKCKKLGVFEEVSQTDLNLLKKSSFSKYKNKFDYIIFGDVLEHTYCPEKILDIIKSYLKSDGKILISIPNLAHASIKANLLFDDFTYTEIGILDKTHVRFFTYKSIAKLISDASLIIEEINYTTLPEDGYQPHKFSELPKTMQEYILKDPHSFVFQYVLKCGFSSKFKTDLLKTNTIFAQNMKVDKTNIIPTPLFKLKRLIITKLSWLIKYIEKIR